MRINCQNCVECDGHGCRNQMPGIGGVMDNQNFILNREGWKTWASILPEDETIDRLPELRLAPLTGAVQNIGLDDEESFYPLLLQAASSAGLRLSIGDGLPDEKLQYGIATLKAAGKKAAIIIKPWSNAAILERVEWALDVAELIGIDIDAWQIPSISGDSGLERKTSLQLRALQREIPLPFCVKGIFLEEDVQLVRELRPDVVVVSNHGGRVFTRVGSTADFLARHALDLAMHSGAVWVDGGLRTAKDIQTAGALGATGVLLGRPVLNALLHGGQAHLEAEIAELKKLPLPRHRLAAIA